MKFIAANFVSATILIALSLLVPYWVGKVVSLFWPTAKIFSSDFSTWGVGLICIGGVLLLFYFLFYAVASAMGRNDDIHDR